MGKPIQLELPPPRKRPWDWERYARRLEREVMDLRAELLRLREKAETDRRARVVEAIGRFNEKR